LYKLYVNTLITLTCTVEDKNETHSSRNGDVVKTR